MEVRRKLISPESGCACQKRGILKVTPELIEHAKADIRNV